MVTGERHNKGDHCHIVAWSGWRTGVEEFLQTLYWQQYQRPLDLSWTRYVGGGEFRSVVEDLSSADVLIGDWELMRAYALQGRLVTLARDESAANAYFQELPNWLARYALWSEQHLFGVPVRWGTTPVLVKRSILERLGEQPAMPDLLGKCSDYLLWSPSGYHLPSMVVLASAANPVRPTALTPSEFTQLRRTLGLVASRGVVVAQQVGEFVDEVLTLRADMVTCAGDWILNHIRQFHPEESMRLEQQYIKTFPRNARVPVFFEMVGVSSSSENTDVARNIARLLCSPDVRRKVQVLDDADGGYSSNPSVGDEMLVGPDKRSYREMLELCTVRDIPTDHRLIPADSMWREEWGEFVSTVEK